MAAVSKNNGFSREFDAQVHSELTSVSVTPPSLHREFRLILFTKALVPPRPEQVKYSLFRRRNRTHSPDRVAKSGAGSAGGKDSVEMKLLSEGGDGVSSTQTSSRHGGASGSMGRRDAVPPTNTPQATFYI